MCFYRQEGAGSLQYLSYVGSGILYMMPTFESSRVSYTVLEAVRFAWKYSNHSSRCALVSDLSRPGLMKCKNFTFKG